MYAPETKRKINPSSTVGVKAPRTENEQSTIDILKAVNTSNEYIFSIVFQFIRNKSMTSINKND